MTFTDWFSCVSVVLLLAVDVLFARRGGEPNTISYRAALWSRKWPLIPLLTGLLMGHLFWPNHAYCAPRAAPDPVHTPGLVDPSHKLSLLCAGSNKNYPRKVSTAMKAQVAAWYGIRRADWPKYEFDHLIPRCAGGADDVRNLWPEPLGDAKQKDVFEEQYCRDICSGARKQSWVVDFFRNWGRR